MHSHIYESVRVFGWMEAERKPEKHSRGNKEGKKTDPIRELMLIHFSNIYLLVLLQR